MPREDLIELLLYTAEKVKEKNVRDDTTIYILKKSSEAITLSDSGGAMIYASHPSKWNTFLWNRATWG
jgi:hypothetical protein